MTQVTQSFLADGMLAQNFEEDISVNICIQRRFKVKSVIQNRVIIDYQYNYLLSILISHQQENVSKMRIPSSAIC